MIFFSYPPKRKSEIKELYEHLKGLDQNPWVDFIDVVPGRSWLDAKMERTNQGGPILVFRDSSSPTADQEDQLDRVKDLSDRLIVVSWDLEINEGAIKFTSAVELADELVRRIIEKRREVEGRSLVAVSFAPPGATLWFRDKDGQYQFRSSPAQVPLGLTFELFDWFHGFVKGEAGEGGRIQLEPYAHWRDFDFKVDYNTISSADLPPMIAHKIRLLLQKLKGEELFSAVDEWSRILRNRAPKWHSTWLIHAWTELVRKRLCFALLYLALVKELNPTTSSAYYLEAVAHGIQENLVGVEGSLMAIANSPSLVQDYQENMPHQPFEPLLEDPFFDPVRAMPGGRDLLASMAQELSQQPGRTEDADELIIQRDPKLPFCLRGFAITKFHGFEDLCFVLPVSPRWLMLTGENAEGKSSLLQTLALGISGDQHVNVWIECQAKPVMYSLLRNGAPGPGLTPVVGYGPNRLGLMAQVDDAEVRNAKERPLENLIAQNGFLLNIEQELKNLALDAHAGKVNANARLEHFCAMLAEMMPTIQSIRVEGSKVWYHDGRQDMELETLSSGNRAVLGLVGDILVRLFYFQPNAVRSEDLQGIVLIDELESHLHPKSQYQLPHLLSKHFPKVQFIASTHSPLPLLGAPEGTCILRVRQDESGQGTLEWQGDLDMARLTPNSLLSSPAFGFQDLFRRGQTDVRSVHTEANYQDIERHRNRNRFLQDEDAFAMIPDEFLEEDTQ